MKSFSILAAALLLMGAAANPPKTSHDCTFSVTVEDYEKEEKIWHWCFDGKDMIRLDMPKGFNPGGRGIITGKRARITGALSSETNSRGVIQPVLQVDDIRDIELLMLPLFPDQSIVAAVFTPLGNAPWTTQPNKVLVANVSYTNQPSQFTNAQVKNFFVTEMAPLLQELSKGATRMEGIKNPSDPGDFVDVTVPAPNGCDPNAVVNAVHAAADAMGYKDQLSPSWAPYRRVYILPFSNCPWSGLASVGGFGDFAISQNQLTTRVLAHELFGHFWSGLYHDQSNTLNSVNCCVDPYSSGPDLMGNQDGLLNPWHLKIAAWLNASASTKVTQSGDYTINAITNQAMNVKSLEIVTSDPNAVLTVSLYACEGHYGKTGQPCPAVYIHWASGNVTQVVAGSIDGAVVWPLALGKTFKMLNQEIYITTKFVNAAQAVINVAFAPPAPPISTGLSFTVTK